MEAEGEGGEVSAPKLVDHALGCCPLCVQNVRVIDGLGWCQECEDDDAVDYLDGAFEDCLERSGGDLAGAKRLLMADADDPLYRALLVTAAVQLLAERMAERLALRDVH